MGYSIIFWTLAKTEKSWLRRQKIFPTKSGVDLDGVAVITSGICSEFNVELSRDMSQVYFLYSFEN